MTSMFRRKYLALFSTGLVGVAGCSSDDSQENFVESSVEVNEKVCDNIKPEIQVPTQQGDSEIEFSGVMSGVNTNKSLKASIYGPSDEDEVICQVWTSGSSDSSNCEGSIKYDGRVTFNGNDVNSIVFIHENDGDEEIIDSYTIE